MGNGYENASGAFGDDAMDSLIREGASGSGALGNPLAATFNLFPGLGNWKTAIAGGGRQHIVIMGDSNVQHQPTQPNRWAQLLHADLLTFTGLSNGGPGFRGLGLTEWAQTSGTFGTTGTTAGLLPTESNLTGTTSDIAPYGVGYTATGNGSVLTWTKPGSGLNAYDRFAVYSQDDDLISLQLEYSVDGGAFTATAIDYSPTLGTRLVKQEIVAAPATSLRLRGGNPVFPNYFNGVAFYQGTSGLVVHNLALGGSDVFQTVGRDRANRLAIIDDLQPKLTIIWTGTNEFTNFVARPQRTSQDFYTYYDKIVARAKQYGDVLMIYPQATHLAGNTIAAVPVPEPQRNYQKAAREIAYKRDAGFIDFHAMWGPWERHNARGWAADDHHLSYTAGHAAAFKIISKMIRDYS